MKITYSLRIIDGDKTRWIVNTCNKIILNETSLMIDVSHSPYNLEYNAKDYILPKSLYVYKNHVDLVITKRNKENEK